MIGQDRALSDGLAQRERQTLSHLLVDFDNTWHGDRYGQSERDGLVNLGALIRVALDGQGHGHVGPDDGRLIALPATRKQRAAVGLIAVGLVTVGPNS